MEESVFNRLADAELQRIEGLLEQCGVALDVELGAGGVLEVEFENGSHIVINRHSVAQEIWVAAKSGGFHFKLREGGEWYSAREEAELYAVLSQVVSEQAGSAVALAGR